MVDGDYAALFIRKRRFAVVVLAHGHRLGQLRQRCGIEHPLLCGSIVLFVFPAVIRFVRSPPGRRIGIRLRRLLGWFCLRRRSGHRRLCRPWAGGSCRSGCPCLRCGSGSWRCGSLYRRLHRRRLGLHRIFGLFRRRSFCRCLCGSGLRGCGFRGSLCSRFRSGSAGLRGSIRGLPGLFSVRRHIIRQFGNGGLTNGNLFQQVSGLVIAHRLGHHIEGDQRHQQHCGKHRHRDTDKLPAHPADHAFFSRK